MGSKENVSKRIVFVKEVEVRRDLAKRERIIEIAEVEEIAAVEVLLVDVIVEVAKQRVIKDRAEKIVIVHQESNRESKKETVDAREK